ncbi:PAS domain-containing protein [Oleiharenicola sp. Vm1]|uniref:hybrid sensor histidine kinase/response regulator n=1 Tax=Oleiharenicola sp. Vm1 TaxID=3398393 RepID=UPI0039F5D5E8
MFGYEPQEFRGRVEEWEAHLHPADLPRVRARQEAVLASGENLIHHEYRVRCKDGTYRWVLDRGKVIERDAAGQPVRLIGTFTDLTEIRRTHQRLALLEAALQAMPAGIVITDPSGRVEWVNAGFSRLTGYSASEVIGANPRLLKSGHHPPEFYAQLWRTILRGEVWSGELVNRRKDGTDYHEHMIIAPVSHGAEGTTHFVAIKQDVTERRQMEQQLLRAQRMEGIGLLAGGIAHDLNNVLAPILLSVELLRMRCQNPADRRTLEVVESAARRGTGVVRQVLTFARGIDGERAPLRPRDLIRELVLMIEETFPRDIDIRRDVADDTPMIRGDATQLHQVLLNLAVNARDAMPNGGTLVFAAHGEELRSRRVSFMGEIPPGSYVVLSVQDTGQGMSAEVRERIFEPFFTTKPRGKGTGLGLPTVLGIVRSHGGFIQLDSQPGTGSVFRIYLPAMPPEDTHSTPPIAGPALAGCGRTVVVCDDEAPVREIAGVVLRQAGFQVLEATNGREAVELFTARRGEIDVVLMDIMMPLMTGDRAAAEMLRVRPDLPLVLMSGLMDHEAVHAALSNVGAKSPPLLRKPFTAHDLLAVMGQVLGAGAKPATA